MSTQPSLCSAEVFGRLLGRVMQLPLVYGMHLRKSDFGARDTSERRLDGTAQMPEDDRNDRPRARTLRQWSGRINASLPSVVFATQSSRGSAL
jgi:hypothetical protein